MSDDDKCLILSDKSKLQWLPKKAETYFNKTTIIYGAPGTGKTTIVDEIMYLCRDKIPVIFVVAPTNAANNAYTNRVPSCCIIQKFSIEWVAEFLNRQRDLAEVCQKCNDLVIIEKMFLKIAPASMVDYMKSLKNCAARTIERIESRDWSFVKIRTQKAEVVRLRDTKLRALYKRVLTENKDRYKASTQEERAILQFINYNPNAMLIFDDCASYLKDWFKQSSSFKDMFYTNRWLNLTVIITTQDDKEIHSELRKSAMLLFFTNAQMATANFDRTSNYYSKNDKRRATECIKTVFAPPEPGEATHYRKMVYIRDATDPFRYTIADLYDEFRFGSDYLWTIDNKIREKRKSDIGHNRFFQMAGPGK